MYQELLSREDLEQIHGASMRLLADVGVNFPHEEALAVFHHHGARVEGQRVYLSEDQVMATLKRAPAQFTLEARNQERSVTIGGGRSVFAPGYGAPFLVDAEVGKRAPVMADYHNLVSLVHDLPNQDLSGYLLVEPSDVPASAVHVHMLHAHIRHSDKPFIGCTAGAQGAHHTMRMARILFGDDLGDRYVTMGLINSLTPLGYSPEMLSALLEYARLRQPLVIAALAMAGSTGPITLAGILGLQTAELLAGIILVQLVGPGTPVVFGSTSTNVHMQTGALAIGSPELSQLIVAHAQLGRFYGLPSRSGGALTDACYPDAQSGFESMMGLLTAVNSGIDFVLHAGGILSSYLAFSYEKLVLDDEMCGMVRRLCQSFEVSPGTLAYDVIAKVGPGGNYLMEDHTVTRCRTEFWTPAIVDRAGLDVWMSRGRQDAVARARRRWQALLDAHQDPPLDRTAAHQLQAYVEEHAG